MFYQSFLSPQVKGWAIITYKHGVYEAIFGNPEASQTALTYTRTNLSTFMHIYKYLKYLYLIAF